MKNILLKLWLHLKISSLPRDVLEAARRTEPAHHGSGPACCREWVTPGFLAQCRGPWAVLPCNTSDVGKQQTVHSRDLQASHPSLCGMGWPTPRVPSDFTCPVTLLQLLSFEVFFKLKNVTVNQPLVNKKSKQTFIGAESPKDKAGCCQGHMHDDIHLHSSPSPYSLSELPWRTERFLGCAFLKDEGAQNGSIGDCFVRQWLS